MPPTFKVPDHQVAGHKALNGQLGPLIDESGRFYKPLQKDDRGSREASFYESFSSDSRVPDDIRIFFPKYYGTESLEASDGSGLHPHLVLDDLTSNYTNPFIMDVKIGSRTWYPNASEEYIQKCFIKDKDTSSPSVGFRVAGLQIYGGEEVGYWKPDRNVTQKYNADEVMLVLKKFVSSKQSLELEKDQDCAFASNVYGGVSGILAKLRKLKSWFEDQTLYHFSSCSVVMIFDNESVVKGDPSPTFKLVDFAHVFEGNGVIDHNFLGGLSSLIKFLSEIVPAENGCNNAEA